jgi:hypothetical protein
VISSSCPAPLRIAGIGDTYTVGPTGPGAITALGL